MTGYENALTPRDRPTARRKGVIQSKAGGTENFESVALFLQGGGALAAYEVGVLEALNDVGLAPNRLGGFSMGAINAAIYAGNPKETRISKLLAFWDSITTEKPFADFSELDALNQRFWDMVIPHQRENTLVLKPSTLLGAAHWPHEIKGICTWSGLGNGKGLYDPSLLRRTIDSLVDYDVMNRESGMRISVGAVEKESGNTVYFNNQRPNRIGINEIMASGAVPELFPNVIIDNKQYFDGGFGKRHHNDPIHEILDNPSGIKSIKPNTLVIQADVWPVNSDPHADPVESAEDRQFGPKRITLPNDFKGTVVHIVCPHFAGDTSHKASDFSREMVSQRMGAGYGDTIVALSQPQIFQRLDRKTQVAVKAGADTIGDLNSRMLRMRQQTDALVLGNSQSYRDF